MNRLLKRPDLRGADDTTRTEAQVAWDELRADYPWVRATLRVAEGHDAQAKASYAWTTPADGAITLNRRYASDHPYWVAEVAESEGRLVAHPGTSEAPARYATIHEFGHALQAELYGRDERSVDNYIDATWRALERAGVDFPPPFGQIAWDLGMEVNKWWVARDLSGYATSAPFEFLAEGFAVYRFFGAGKSVLADAVHATLTEDAAKRRAAA